MLDTFTKGKRCHPTDSEIQIYCGGECDDVLLLLADLIEGAASENDRERIALHVCHCQRCLEVVVELLSQAVGEDVNYQNLLLSLHAMCQQADSSTEQIESAPKLELSHIEYIDEVANTRTTWRIDVWTE